MLSWAMGIVSRKKKVSMPKITISDFVPHVVVPPNGKSFIGHLETQEPSEFNIESSEAHVDPKKKHSK